MVLPRPVVLLQSVSEGTALMMKLRRVITNVKTKYQNLIIVEFDEYGRALVLDDLVQSTEADEYIYHESLTHPIMTTHVEPRNILIIGGGEGATLREVLKHSTVSRAVMVDIDGELVNYAERDLEVMHQGSFKDSRAEKIIMDGKEYVKVTNNIFDVVVIDLTDPYGPEIARELYTGQFYREVYKVLTDDGLMVTQAGNSFYYEETYDFILQNINSVFPIVREYNVWIPSFGYACNFIIGSKKYDPASLTIEDINDRLKIRNVKTYFYSGATHKALFLLPICRRKNYIIRSTLKHSVN
ncbi:MAG: polyamine aminopropyltransferase [Candidatus Methanomethylicia archaeon]